MTSATPLGARPSRCNRIRLGLGALLGAAALTACNEKASDTGAVRPVRTQVVEITKWSQVGTAVGEIKPRYESDISFRTGGKVAERPVDVGASVDRNSIIGRLDSTNEETARRISESDLNAATAEREDARRNEARQRELLQRGIATQVSYDAAERRLKQAEAKVEAAELARKDAADRLGYTTLRSDVDGVVTAVGAQPGQVVAAGQMVARIARTGIKDAEFKISERTLRSAPPNPVIEVWLLADPAIKATGYVREVATTADPVTRTYAVRVALNEPPESMRFGATVQGRIAFEEEQVVRLPTAALFRSDKEPAVWVFDPQKSTVDLRSVKVLRYETDEFLVSGGLAGGERVVTAGVQKLWPGMRVRLP
jgi:RND family efflux transporter MFP subunit